MSDQPTMEFPSLPDPAPGGRRRRCVPVVIAVLAVLALALPAAVFLLMRQGRQPTEPAAPRPLTPAPVSSSPSPTPSSTSGPSRAAPDGRTPLAMLRNATVDLPPWPADNVRGPSGRIRLHDGEAILAPREVATGQPPYGTHIALLSVTYGDVDRDGAEETVAEFICGIEGGSEQLVAFDRDRSGHIVTLGRVLATTGEIRDIEAGSARVSGSGTVTARVSDYQGCCDDQTHRLSQWRGYRLMDGKFIQTTGPARMPLNPYVTETSLSAGTLRLGPAVDGYRYGTIDVTAGHVRGVHPSRLILTFYLPDDLQPWGAHWPTATPTRTVSVTVDAPPANGRTTYSFAFRRPVGLSGGSLDVESRASTRASETMPWDNFATARIRTVD